VSELSAVGKIKRAMKLAKLMKAGMTLSYFDVIELLGEIESLEETIRVLDTRDDDALVTAYRKDNAELKRQLADAEQYKAHNTVLLARALRAEEEVELYRKDNSTLADEAIAYKKRAKRAVKENRELLAKNSGLRESYIRAVNMANDLYHLGNILLNQDGMIDECVKQVEDEWRKLVAEWRGDGE
jgi:tetratricopeptide (TPR) repeat protein